MLSHTIRRCAAFNRVVVFGGGTMGGGIAQTIASFQIPTTIVDVSDAALQRSKQTITVSLERITKKMAEKTGPESAKAFFENTLSNLTFSSSPEAAVSVPGTDLVIEAVIENMELKTKLWSQIDKVAPVDCVFCSNTSSLSIAAQAAVTKRAQRFAGLHFFSPVVMMRLVEVVRTEETDPEVIQRCMTFVREIQKEPVLCRDTKGFIVNRLLVPFLLEAGRMVERGDATIEDVDKAMRLGAGHPMGPFALMDNLGVDVAHLINKAWNEEEPNEPLFKVVKLIEQKYKEGKLGRKTGEGFFDYSKK